MVSSLDTELGHVGVQLGSVSMRISLVSVFSGLLTCNVVSILQESWLEKSSLSSRRSKQLVRYPEGPVLQDGCHIRRNMEIKNGATG